jgi:hypothetical protein
VNHTFLCEGEKNRKKACDALIPETQREVQCRSAHEMCVHSKLKSRHPHFNKKKRIPFRGVLQQLGHVLDYHVKAVSYPRYFEIELYVM